MSRYDYIPTLLESFTTIDLAIFAVPERSVNESIQHACRKLYKKQVGPGKQLLKGLAYHQDASTHYNRLRSKLGC